MNENKFSTKEEEYLKQVLGLESKSATSGTFTNDLENIATIQLQRKYAIAQNSGTSTLHSALLALGISDGDEVISPSFTVIMNTAVTLQCGAIPVYVDVDLETYVANDQALEAAISPKTKAIIPVHLFGQVANMDKVIEIAKSNSLYVIEDNAQGIGSTYISSNNSNLKSGTIGDIGTTSFFPSKNLGCYGDGGAIFTNNDELAHVMRGIVNHGMYVRYHHDVVGVNSRLDSVQAAILSVKLPLLDFYNERRKEASLFYSKELNQNKNNY